MRNANEETRWLAGRDYVRNLVRKRDKYTCQDCRRRLTPKKAKEQGKRMFDVHHLNGLCGKMSRGYDSIKDLSGLVTLCRKCHFGRHEWSGKEKMKKRLYGAAKKKRDARIMSYYDIGYTYKELAKKFNLSTAMVNNIILGKQ